MRRLKLLWHTPSNFLAVADFQDGGLPLITVLDDEFTGINPFYSYPFSILTEYGWVDLGDLIPEERP